MERKICIAIDGPAGAGKSTVARLVASRLGYRYLDTGAMYRALTWQALQNGLDFVDEPALVNLARTADIQLLPTADGSPQVLINGQDVTLPIRSQQVSQHVSLLAKVPGVRREMVQRQRQLAAGGGVVVEGRDIGTRVLPQAELKIFLTASPRVRAARRAAELADRGEAVDVAQLTEEIARRDAMDASREVDPLRPAPDALYLDCSQMSIAEVVEYIVDRARGVK
ncbi:(d)CMP kinase [Desulfurispora thermophila]|uniref:(d)CMP kinase n=1 Tax=Desulfurispora thermophila TaxID=265470 RepID=UPI000368193D|nr:(d)CMP kinase [Desulfurispora thermophila]